MGLTIAVTILFIACIGSAGALWLSSTADSLMHTLSVNWQVLKSKHFIFVPKSLLKENKTG